MGGANARTSDFAVTVVTSNHGGHTPEAIAEMCVGKILFVAETAPPELAQQAEAFRQQLLGVILQYVRLAATEDRATVCAKLTQSGLSDLAAHIRSL